MGTVQLTKSGNDVDVMQTDKPSHQQVPYSIWIRHIHLQQHIIAFSWIHSLITLLSFLSTTPLHLWRSCHDCDTWSTLYHSVQLRPHVYCPFHCMYLCFPIFSTLLVLPLISECSVHSISLYNYLLCFRLQFWLLSVPVLLYLLIQYALGNQSPISLGWLIVLHDCAHHCSSAFLTPRAFPCTFYSSI